ncbi:DsbA family protein [Gordonia zhaorongruii]|uniref:DsbA family protein n=1 Tax=Gordonia zhaorongruii TaxID=2597659 RepID=UPI001052C2FF|nr:thioredoxin domain-containing protein [Gordonia zhaorongruii]
MRSPAKTGRRTSHAARLLGLGSAAIGVIALGACSVDGDAVREAGAAPWSTSSTPSSPSTSGATAPVGSDGAFRITPEKAAPKVTVTAIEDLACPACKRFESVIGSDVADLADDPDVALEYRMIAFLDRMSDDRYSSRAANASYCVWHRETDQADRVTTWRKFQQLAFDGQPDEGGPGLPDSELAAFAEEAGAGDAQNCISGEDRADEVKATTERTLGDAEFEGTPTVLVNGEQVTVASASDLTDAVEKAKRG